MSAAPRWPSRRSTSVGAAILITYGYRSGMAWLLAVPYVNAVNASGLMSFPEGDRKLFEGGGLFLMELLQSQRHVLGAALASTAGLLLLLAFGGIGPEWLLLRALGKARPAAAPHAGRDLTRLALLGALTWLVRALALGVTLMLALTVRSYFAAAEDERIPDLSFLAVAGCGVLVQAGISLLHDLASAAVVGVELNVSRASGLAFAGLRRGWPALSARYGAYALVQGLLVIGCAGLVAALDVSRAGTWRSISSLALHQLSVLLLIATRSYWLSRALRAVARQAVPMPPTAIEA
jgi:hypothetical protein